MLDVRFPTIVQMMLSLALAQEEDAGLLNSAQLAEGAGTNAAVIRRLLPLLSRAGLVEVVKGRDGGIRLAQPTNGITLKDIYDATFDGEPLWHTREKIPHRCIVTNNFCSFFQGVTQNAEDAIRESLGAKTLADSLCELRTAEAAASASI